MVPRSRGGPHAWENCVASCNRCNHRKADRLIEELGWTLPRAGCAAWPALAPDRRAHDGDPHWVAYLTEPSAA